MLQKELSDTFKELITADIIHPVGRGKIRVARTPAKLILGMAGATAYQWDCYLCAMEPKAKEWTAQEQGQVRYARNAKSILLQLSSQCLTGIKIDDLLVGLHYLSQHFEEYDISRPGDYSAYIKRIE